MGYFDALTSGSFKTTEDGRRLFFPWGILGRGYIIPSEADFERLRRHLKAYTIISLLLGIVAVTWKGSPGAAAILPLLVVPHALWARSQCQRLRQTSEELTLSESVAAQAHGRRATGLWLLELAALAFVAGGVLILVLDPGNWLVGAASIVVFGLCAARYARILVTKRREARSRP